MKKTLLTPEEEFLLGFWFARMGYDCNIEPENIESFQHLAEIHLSCDAMNFEKIKLILRK